MILVVGAGLAGLVCARVLQERGADFLLLEADATAGGRVRTDEVDGYRLDRGFQVLLDSYPAVRRHLDLRALDLRPFDSGAVLFGDNSFARLMNPLRHPQWLAASALDDVLPLGDRFRLAAIAASAIAHPDNSLLARCASPADETTRAHLRRLGISEATVRRFIQPFFGGVFLDNELTTSAGLFTYYLKKFATGRALIPARGMGEIPGQLAASLPAARLRTNAPVAALTISDGRATGVTLDSGETLPGTAVILATDEPSTLRILGQDASAARPTRSTIVVYLSTDESLYSGRVIVLPAGPDRLVRHFVQISNLSRSLAPSGQHLISATILDPHGLTDADLAAAATAEIREAFPAARLDHVKTVSVPRALPIQNPGFAAHLPNPPRPTNVHLAGDQTRSASIQAAMESGEEAALTALAR